LVKQPPNNTRYKKLLKTLAAPQAMTHYLRGCVDVRDEKFAVPTVKASLKLNRGVREYIAKILVH